MTTGRPNGYQASVSPDSKPSENTSGRKGAHEPAAKQVGMPGLLSVPSGQSAHGPSPGRKE